MTTNQAAERLGVDVDTLRKAIKHPDPRYRLRAVKEGRDWKIFERDLASWLRRKRNPGQPRKRKPKPMGGARSMKRSMVLLALCLCASVVALLLGCTGPAGEDGADGKDLTDDDADAGDDDSAGGGTDDDEAPACWQVWAECEYNAPWDGSHVDECGEQPDDVVDPDGALTWERCVDGLTVDYWAALIACGSDGGCADDWKADYYGCVLNYWTLRETCANQNSSFDLFTACNDALSAGDQNLASCGNR